MSAIRPALLQLSRTLALSLAAAALAGCHSEDHCQGNCDSGERFRQANGSTRPGEQRQDQGWQQRQERMQGERRMQAPRSPADPRQRTHEGQHRRQGNPQGNHEQNNHQQNNHGQDNHGQYRAAPGSEPGGPRRDERTQERATLERVHAEIHRRLDAIERRLQALEGRGEKAPRKPKAR